MKMSGQLPVLIFALCLFIISVCGLPIKWEGNPENGPRPGLEDIGDDLKHTCVNEGKNPPGEFHKQLEDECICTITHGTRNCLMMWNSTSVLACSQCCKDHYWDRNLKKCKECAPSGMREGSNVATNCLPRPEWKSENSTQETPPSTTTSKKVVGKNNENAAEFIRVSTKTPMKTEETIKQYNSTTGSAGESVVSEQCMEPYIENGRVIGKHFEVGASVTFICSLGYQLNGNETIICQSNLEYDFTYPTCEDYNECRNLLCHPNASCQNTMGSVFCFCKEGFVGDGLNSCKQNYGSRLETGLAIAVFLFLIFTVVFSYCAKNRKKYPYLKPLYSQSKPSSSK